MQHATCNIPSNYVSSSAFNNTLWEIYHYVAFLTWSTNPGFADMHDMIIFMTG